MSFCCGASMVGTKGTVKHVHTRIHHVPLLVCPVCHRTEVHYLARSEYEILAEYAYGDGTEEIDFLDYVEGKEGMELFENCVSHELENPWEIVTNQIDMGLDLLFIAKQLKDEEWEIQLKKRLKVMSHRRNKLKSKKSTSK